MKDYDKIFNSEEQNGSKSFQLANGYISSTTIFLEKNCCENRSGRAFRVF